MKIKLQHVLPLVNGVLYAALAIALVLIIADYNIAGVVIAAVVVVMNRALKSIRVKAWLIEKLTGVPREAVLQIDHDRKGSEARRREDRKARLSPAKLDRLLSQEERPGILLKRHWPPDQPATQNSWLGGLPKLPDGLAWPHHPETGLALHHLAQIDLSEMPLPEAGPQLPRRGTLFFFADIEESMNWEDGPDTGHSAVLYTDLQTRDLDHTPAPGTLPEVDHTRARMTGTSWGFRPCKFHVYARWPITGHAVPTWPMEGLPKGVDYRSGYSEALEARIAQVRRDVLGAPRKTHQFVSVINRTWVETEGADGKKTGGDRISIDEEAFGPGFPFNGFVAREYLRDIDKVVRCDLETAERSIAYAKKRERAPSEYDLTRRSDAKRLLPKVEALLAEVSAVDDTEPPGATLAGRIRALITDTAGTSRGTEAWVDGQPQRRAILRALAHGISTPALLERVPPRAIEAVAGLVLPAHEYTKHYMLGAKGASSNPTSGRGVRLLQLDSDYALEFMFCDCGIIDFWIAPEDLEAGRWDRAWAATAGG